MKVMVCIIANVLALDNPEHTDPLAGSRFFM